MNIDGRAVSVEGTSSKLGTPVIATFKDTGEKVYLWEKVTIETEPVDNPRP